MGYLSFKGAMGVRGAWRRDVWEWAAGMVSRFRGRRWMVPAVALPVIRPEIDCGIEISGIAWTRGRGQARVNGNAIGLKRLAGVVQTATVRGPEIVDWENRVVLPPGIWFVRPLPCEIPGAEAQGHSALTHDDTCRAFLARSTNRCTSSPFVGLLYGCYDLDDRTYRLESWVWTSAIVARTWFGDSDAAGAKNALALASALAQRQIRGGAHDGGFVVRVDVEPASASGEVTWLAPNDAALIGGYALSPLYRKTGDPSVLAQLERLGAWIERTGIAEDGRLRAGFRVEEAKWDDDWLYVDSAFVTVLFRELAALTDEPGRWRLLCSRFASWFVSAFDHPSGAFIPMWKRRSRQSEIRNFFSRGLGWGIEGLVSAYECTGEERFLQRAVRAARFCAATQNRSGAWYFYTDEPSTGECNKATPVLAYALARVFAATGDTLLLSTAKKALEWCRLHRYFGPDPNAVGGIVSWTWEGCITHPRNRRTAVPYATAFAIEAERILRDRAS